MACADVKRFYSALRKSKSYYGRRISSDKKLSPQSQLPFFIFLQADKALCFKFFFNIGDRMKGAW